MIRTILTPDDPLPQAASIAYTTLSAFAPLAVETILILRLLALYPSRSTPRLTFLIIVSIPSTIHVIRMINCATYLWKDVGATNGAESPLVSAFHLWGDWQVKFEWILQTVDVS
ncbi:hypothetical protein SERLA73DRAFT_141772 [Serpula lacrymans var. lacrymans S7.3]|uniref:Uncharacterized protein n=1 Tax=Serpula lacrymans var. lacrymans (strain S7.3) TaxID=936435 RepID=F8Q6Z1_SERL3|nr:hypothetical protein SERLA73DRAFT_141772 [Serpula lacrymans var. lacrymans S7.3]